MDYRADIDGLRAIAVLSVIFFHLGFTDVFSSGYAGVDVFFVISGFLITSIIYRDIVKGEFSFLDFYERRVRRILPVFIFVVFTTLLAAYFVNLYDFAGFSDSLLSALAMGANFYFWKDTGYFGLAASTKPLLHTWSLGVEEQFYIIFPLLVIFFRSNKFVLLFTRLFNTKGISAHKATLFFLLFLWVCSFVLCVIQSYSSASTAFYLLPYRFWELLTGAVLAIFLMGQKDNNFLCNHRTIKRFSGTMGVGLLCFSMFFLESLGQPFPGFVAIFPCLGTAFCIFAGHNTHCQSIHGTRQSLNIYVVRFLSYPLLKYIGKISFSLYLWHWVVIVLVKEILIAETEVLDVTLSFYCLLLIILCSIFSYYIIEQPVRKKVLFKTSKTLFCSMLALGIATAILALAIKYEIIPQKMNNDMKYYRSISHDNNFPKLPPPPSNAPRLSSASIALFGDPTVSPTLLVLGDSHAQMLFSVLDSLAKEHKVSGIMCTSFLNDFFYVFENERFSAKQALENAKNLQKYLEQFDIKGLLLSSLWLTPAEYDELKADQEKNMNTGGVLRFVDPVTHEITTDPLLAIQFGVTATLDHFKNSSTKFFIKKNVPKFPWIIPRRASKLAKVYKKEDVEFRKKMSMPYEIYAMANKSTIKDEHVIDNLQFIDLSDGICDGEYCYGISQNGEALYYDNNHLIITATLLFKDKFMPFILSGK